MARPKAGVSDELNLEVTKAPKVRITTAFTHEALKRLRDHIKKLPEMKGFELMEADEEKHIKFDGICFSESSGDEGSMIIPDRNGRLSSPKIVILQFKVKDLEPSQLIVPLELASRIDALKGAINNIPQIKTSYLKVTPRIVLSGYKLGSGLPPSRFDLALEYYPPEQKEYDREKMRVRAEELKRLRRNAVENVLRKKEKGHA